MCGQWGGVQLVWHFNLPFHAYSFVSIDLCIALSKEGSRRHSRLWRLVGHWRYVFFLGGGGGGGGDMVGVTVSLWQVLARSFLGLLVNHN